MGDDKNISKLITILSKKTYDFMTIYVAQSLYLPYHGN